MYRNKKDKDEIRQIIEYTFKNEHLLLQALTRRSALNEGLQKSGIGDFQRLEFIGDRVLDMVISDILFDNYPDWNEGQLTQELSRLTNNSGPLHEVAERLKLGKFLILGSGEEQMNVRRNVKALSDALEALVGAIWIDSDHDYKFMKRFIRKQFRTLKLIDFNEEYKEQTVKIASKQIFFDTMDDIIPELAEFGFGSRGMTVGEILNYKHMQKKATKPLTGFAASCERYLERTSDNSDNSNSSDKGSDEEKQEDPKGKGEASSTSKMLVSQSSIFTAPVTKSGHYDNDAEESEAFDKIDITPQV
jgi:dsRNA-specific ribonuclease